MKKPFPSTILLMRYNEKNQKNHCRKQWLFKINRNEKQITRLIQLNPKP